MNINRFETAKVRSRKRCRSMIGSLCRHSHITRKISDAVAMTVRIKMKCDSNQSSRSPLVEDDLAAPEAHRHQTQADVVDPPSR